MKTILIAAIACMAASPALAINRYYSDKLSEQQIYAILEQEGEVIFWFASSNVPGLKLYNRFVSNVSYCAGGEAAVSASVPSAGGSSASVKICAVHSPSKTFGSSGSSVGSSGGAATGGGGGGGAGTDL